MKGKRSLTKTFGLMAAILALLAGMVAFIQNFLPPGSSSAPPAPPTVVVVVNNFPPVPPAADKTGGKQAAAAVTPAAAPAAADCQSDDPADGTSATDQPCDGSSDLTAGDASASVTQETAAAADSHPATRPRWVNPAAIAKAEARDFDKDRSDK